MSRLNDRKFLILFALLSIFCITACLCKEARPPVVINFSNAAKKPVVVDGRQEPRQGRDKKTGAVNEITKTGQDIPAEGPAKLSADLLTPEPAAAPVRRQIVAQRTDEASFFNAQVHDLAVQLVKNFRGEASPDNPVAVTTFVDLNNFYRTSPFGRYLSEQLMGELQRAGFRVLEVRKTDSILIKERYGEYSLSRDIEEIAKQSAAQFVLVGTYVTRDKYILINARLVSNKGKILTSSAMKILRRDAFLDRMLWPTSSPQREPAIRIPIRSMGQLSDVKIISGS